MYMCIISNIILNFILIYLFSGYLGLYKIGTQLYYILGVVIFSNFTGIVRSWWSCHDGLKKYHSYILAYPYSRMICTFYNTLWIDPCSRMICILDYLNDCYTLWYFDMIYNISSMLFMILWLDIRLIN